MSENKKQHEEEVDLGSLFIIIGKGFSNFFNFIGGLFKGLFHYTVLFLVYLKKHILKFAIAGVLGGFLGFFVDSSKENEYYSEMMVQPNYGSSTLLYRNVDYYNDLIIQEDSLMLSKVFNISSSEAKSLRKFKIQPIKNRKDVIKGYNSLITTSDTLAIKSFSFKDFELSITDFDYKYHSLRVIANDKKVFKKLTRTIVSSLTNNKFFRNTKDLTNENYRRTDSILRNELSEIDSLRNVFKSVLIEEAKNPSKDGTNIDFGKSQGTSRELELFTISNNIDFRLTKLLAEKSSTSEVINVLTDFSEVGILLSGIENNYILLFGIIGVLIVLASLVVIDLNKYLENYKK